VSELKKLARLVFEMTRRQIWLGGKVVFLQVDHGRSTRIDDDWPEEVEFPDLGSGVIWTMSPEVELGGHAIRVCVSASPNLFKREGCKVRVFVDGQIKYPGGVYEQPNWAWTWLWGENWATRLARIEISEGGRTGPVHRRDQLITEAKKRLQTAQVKHHPTPIDPVDPAAEEAVREVEALIATRKALHEQN